MVGIGVIGFGYWGPNLARNFSQTDGFELRWIVDEREGRRETARRQYPNVQLSANVDGLLADPDVDAVVISTPTNSHYSLAMRALEAGKHVLVEKPMTTTGAEGRKLVEEARRRGLVLLVDHTFIYTPAVRRIRQLVQSGEVGELLYYDSTRINLGLFQHDVDVLWDLAVHDLSILSFLVDEAPIAVSAVGKSHVAGAPENIAYLTLVFDGAMIAHINVNWLAPVKIRRTIIGGSRKMIVYDDLEPSEKIKIYDKGVDVAETPDEVLMMRVNYRIGDMWAPNLENAEALRVEAGHFLDCIRNGVAPETSGEVGLRVVKVLEAATLSMRLNGCAINVDTLEPKDATP